MSFKIFIFKDRIFPALKIKIFNNDYIAEGKSKLGDNQSAYQKLTCPQ